ncbi:sterol desaturase family protein [Marinoscillum sp. MHG1-6]|uniref:sterol desaturase family protein n=1 Tax=Marinoscillum sp. MHG1-6 TaxID=2959627 RepID=UPI0021574403|nr:sterol desaturase family protein [Marinoscillum sp. MHG1-6]
MSEVIKTLDLTLTMLPLLLMALGLEFFIGYVRGKKLYRLKDTLANVATGLLISIPGFLCKAAAFGLYSFVYQLAPWEMGNSWWAFVLCFLGSDLIYYLFHRLGHQTQLFWAGHVTHHSSREFNLSIAVRFPFQVLYRFIFWTPLALLGFHPSMIILTDSIVFIYAFYLHTKLVGKLGSLEWLFNTPSHHRVHHSSNEVYLDTNFGGVFIIWDRLFGTFREETEKPQYGLTHEVNTHNPFRLQFDEYIYTFRSAIQKGSLIGALKYLLDRPTPHALTAEKHVCSQCTMSCPFKNPLDATWSAQVVQPLLTRKKAA